MKKIPAETEEQRIKNYDQVCRPDESDRGIRKYHGKDRW